jgi:flagellar biosynthesis/type III secretory pathway M-ring protein FliF/YscJ
MDFIRAQFNRIQQQLSGLTASQKMLTAALVAIMVMTLFWWARYAGTPEMEPVLDQSFSGDDISRITAHIRAKGIDYTVVGDKVLVPTDRKFEVLADLGYAQLLPRDTKTGFDEIVKQMSPWDSTHKQQVMWNRATEMTLAQVIRSFPGVTNAVVVIDPTNQRMVGDSVRPSASVIITTRGGAKSVKQLVDSARDVVAGAVAAASRQNISVIVDGVTHRPRDPDNAEDMSGGDNGMIERMQQWERHYADNISTVLSYIPGLMVGVSVELNTKSSVLDKQTYDPTVVSKPLEEQQETEETTAAPAPAGEPGVGANIAVSVAGAGSAPSGEGSSNTEKTTRKFQLFPNLTRESIKSPAGSGTIVAIAVRVPESYFVEIFKRRNPNVKDPDRAALEPLIAAELPKIRTAVKGCTSLKDDTAITVETYPDVVQATVEAAPASATSVSVLLGGHGKEIAVGALAVVSLFMVSMMVRKNAPAPVIAEPEPLPPQLQGGEPLVGEAAEGNPAMDAMELDDDAVKAKQMLDQVSTLVNENPDAAATLVKRWLNRP